MTDQVIDADRGTKIAVDFARNELGKTQPYLATFAMTVREWLLAGGKEKISFNKDGTAK